MRCVSILSLLAITVACNTVESEDVETDGMNAEIYVHRLADGEGTNVAVYLKMGATTFVDLSAEDKLAAKGGEETVDLKETTILGTASYAGKLALDEVDAEVTVDFQRELHEPAPNSVVALPAKVDVGGLDEGADVSRAAAITLALDIEASDDAVRLDWSGDCVKSEGLDVAADATTVDIAAGSIEKRDPNNEEEPEDVPDSCDITFKATRNVEGTLDEHFGGGFINSKYESSLRLHSEP